MTRLYSVDPHKRSANVHFDWLTAVIPIPDENVRYPNDLNDWAFNTLHQLGVTYDFELMNHGLYTYDIAYNSGDGSIIIAYDNESLMIQMSGSGVESFESVLKFNQGSVISNYINDVVDEFQGTFSRVDACCNFFNYPKEYSARYAGEEAKAGHLVTRSSRCRLVREFDSKGADDSYSAYIGPYEGYTLYVGRNPKQLRIYNKLAERSSKLNQLYNVDSWSRWEFQLNGDNAQLFIDSYRQRDCDLSATWVDWLSSNYRFIEIVGHQQKRSRYPNASWYDAIVKKHGLPIKLRKEKQKPTLERTGMWLNRQVYPSIADIYMARYLKYVENGVSDEDAKSLAKKYIFKDIDDVVVNREYHEMRVKKWLSENEDII